MDDNIHVYKGGVFSFTQQSGATGDNYIYLPDGALVVSGGKVLETGTYADIRLHYPDAVLTDYSGYLLMPGLIDSHVHFPQIEMIGMYGRRLLDWLNDYTFPAEQAYRSPEWAEVNADFFVNELFRHGTTACMAYAATYPTSVDALFAAASRYDMLMMTGKMLMNRNAPVGLLDTTVEGEEDTRRLIERWHGKGRNRYVITPRFAITSTMDQLQMAGRLHRDYPDTYIQTHLSESQEEIKTVKQLFPDCYDYLDVYEKAGLLTNHTVFGHCVHLSDNEWERIREAGAVVAHCPTSNLFLGSGLYSLRQADRYHAQTTLATDVGGGTSLSMFRTMGEAYKVQQLNGYPVSPLRLLYDVTLGTARALGLDGSIGSFQPGADADFIVVDYLATPLMEARADCLMKAGKWTIENILFGMQILGDDRCINATYIKGLNVYIDKDELI